MLTLETIRREVAAVAAKRGARKVILFGSFARGTATERSDLDLIVVEETGERFVRRAGPWIDEIGERLPVCVEVLVYTPEELESIGQRPFIRRALAEGIVLHESGSSEFEDCPCRSPGRRRRARGGGMRDTGALRGDRREEP